MKKSFIIGLVFVILICISFVFPVKFCVKSYPTNCNKEFYVVRLDCLKNWWILAGDSNGLYDWDTTADQYVDIVGVDFQDVVSEDLYKMDMPTNFIVWGHGEYKDDSFVIYCEDWDVLENIYSQNKFRMNFSNKYLTIYDYKWFDYFRKIFCFYDE